MHMRDVPDDAGDDPGYPNGVSNEVYAFLARRCDAFLEQGVPLEQIAFDPGLGFGKTVEQNWELLREVETAHARRRSACRRLAQEVLDGNGASFNEARRQRGRRRRPGSHKNAISLPPRQP